MKKNIRIRVYHALVNEVPGIRSRYQSMRKNQKSRWKSWLYLAVWNFQYYIMGRRHFQDNYYDRNYRKKKLILGESEKNGRKTAKELEEFLGSFDIISFDIFDTLLLRPFGKPEDLFYFTGMELSCLNFTALRKDAEAAAREKKYNAQGTHEVTLEEIWEELEQETGIKKEAGIETEWKTECRYCFANPYFKLIAENLRNQGKILVVTSDMYLSKKQIMQLLKQAELGDFTQYFVSSETGKSKARGDLYELVKETFGENRRYVHIGDNLYSDVKMAEQRGFKAVWYENIQEKGSTFRPEDMSAITGSMYRGIINSRLYCGLQKYPVMYEYGFIYGGLLAVGYCEFIRDFTVRNRIDKILFLARDGDVLKKVYDLLYADAQTEYVLWSRSVSLRLGADYGRHEFFQRFLYHKINQDYTVEQIFKSMKLDILLPGFCSRAGCMRDEKFTQRRAEQCRSYLLLKWEQVLKNYEKERKAAGEYMEGILKGCEKAAAVDIGWAGSGAVLLDALVNREWNMNCKIYGLLAGTNTFHNAEPDTSEGFFFQGSLVPYIFSQSHNRDLWKFHNPNEKHNLYLELLFSAVSPTFTGFDTERETGRNFLFGKQEENPEIIAEIQQGILDFALDWKKHFSSIFERNQGKITGRDAYAPIICMLNDRQFLEKLDSAYDWRTNINAE